VLSLRKAGLLAGESVLVLGATGPLGAAVVQLARLAGAKRVITAGRNPDRLAQVSPAADGVALLGEEPLPDQLAFLGGPVDLDEPVASLDPLARARVPAGPEGGYRRRC
jgi:threonine dehydrogenase-like Zn-dependent dehydrogenase